MAAFPEFFLPYFFLIVFPTIKNFFYVDVASLHRGHVKFKIKPQIYSRYQNKKLNNKNEKSHVFRFLSVTKKILL